MHIHMSVHVVYICVHNKHHVVLMTCLSYVSFSTVQPTWESFQDARSSEEVLQIGGIQTVQPQLFVKVLEPCLIYTRHHILHL